MASYGFSPPTRIFEAAGAAACIISDSWEGMEFFLEPGREVLVAKDGAEVALTLLGLNPSRAREIGAAAYQRVLEHHTYSHRVDQLESLLGVSRTSSNSSIENSTRTAASTSTFTG
jgi:spore maturation protein CgeB